MHAANLLTIVRCGLANLGFAFLWLLHGTRLKYRLPLRSACVPAITIRNNGRVSLANTKLRRSISMHCDGGDIHFGENCFVNTGCSFNSRVSIKIGNGVLFGESVKIYDHDHEIRTGFMVAANDFVAAPVVIGDNCWIGSNCVILKGVQLCSNTIIGSGAIVTKSITEPGIYIAKSLSQFSRIEVTRLPLKIEQ